MTTAELNRDVKRLAKKVVESRKLANDEFFEVLESEIKPEFERLHGADRGLEYMNLSSVKIMIVLNRGYHIIPEHRFFIQATL